jgi:hypothetical protein
MNSNSVVDREDVLAALTALDTAVDTVAGLPWAALTAPELVAVLGRLEVSARRLPALGYAVINRLAAQASPVELGGTSLADVLVSRLRISRGEARRRVGEADDLAERVVMTGETVAPQLPATAAAVAAGRIGAEHVRVIRGFLRDLPCAVDVGTREAAEHQLAQLATTLAPEQLRKAADRLAALLNPDGDFDDVDRARRRHLCLGAQGPDGMTPIRGLLDPEARATLDAVLAKWAAPGMCNPEDPTPTVDTDPSPTTVAADRRSQPQRNHDALKALARAMLASGSLGAHRGLPATIIVSTTLTELQAAAGHAVTGGGSLLPMTDVLRLATHAHHYLAIFNDAGRPLHLGRSKRLASADQRIVLHAKDRGCTFPGCTKPGYLSEVHHITEWRDGGHTNIDDLTFACGPHHDLIDHGWSTRKNRAGITEWIPPPQRQLPVVSNDYHHPDRLLLRDDDDPRKCG